MRSFKMVFSFFFFFFFFFFFVVVVVVVFVFFFFFFFFFFVVAALSRKDRCSQDSRELRAPARCPWPCRSRCATRPCARAPAEAR